MKRQREHFIVDGYNVLNSWPELIALQKDLSEARDRLIHTLAEYGAYEKYDVTLVFDALFTADEEHEEQVNAHRQRVLQGISVAERQQLKKVMSALQKNLAAEE